MRVYLIKESKLAFVLILVGLLISPGGDSTRAWSSLPVGDDPLVRMPGTQPDQGVSLEAPGRCLNCHGGFDQEVEPGRNWKGSMMAQSARDFLFLAAMTVGGQDSIWALGNPNATDICLRCHFPKGWLEGRSDPTNASLMTGADFDGVQCDFCHLLVDPFFETTKSGEREGSYWLDYWDETNQSDTPSQTFAEDTYAEDALLAQAITLFNGESFFTNNVPFSDNYNENGSGQYFVSSGGEKRASFADADARHQFLYSRFHKSKYFCSACHDVSNPVLANLNADPAHPLPTELESANSYFHVERTFSEFILSAYGQQGGAPGLGPFSPGIFETSLSNNYIARCQDCHMRDVVGQGCDLSGAPIRPGDSLEHPESGQPLHDLTGGNVWVSFVLASAVEGSSNYDLVNASLINQGADVLTLDLSQGEGIDPQALLAGMLRAEKMLRSAAVIQNLEYDSLIGSLSLRIQNQTGHKLISGFPEGRRMFLNIKAFKDGSLIYEVNPYDVSIGTLKGLPHSQSSPTLGENEAYVDELVYEMHPSSTLTGEDETFHFVLADGRYKDNRIPPKGFRIGEAEVRLSEPVWEGISSPSYYTLEEYAGGYDDVTLVIPPGGDFIEVNLYYQTTSREYIEFLRDEINGTGELTLTGPGVGGDPAYLIQSDPFFSQLKAWGDTIWQLWTHNKDVPGAAPFLMTQAVVGVPSNPTSTPTPTSTSTTTTLTTETSTNSPTPTGTPTSTTTANFTSTPTASQTWTAIPNQTPTPTPSSSYTPTATSSQTQTSTPTVIVIPSNTSEPSATTTPNATASQTTSPSTATYTPTITPSNQGYWSYLPIIERIPDVPILKRRSKSACTLRCDMH